MIKVGTDSKPNMASKINTHKNTLTLYDILLTKINSDKECMIYFKIPSRIFENVRNTEK